MVRYIVSDIAEIASLALFMGSIAILAQLVGAH